MSVKLRFMSFWLIFSVVFFKKCLVIGLGMVTRTLALEPRSKVGEKKTKIIKVAGEVKINDHQFFSPLMYPYIVRFLLFETL